MLSPEELLELTIVLGEEGIDKLIRCGVEQLSNALGDDWATERVCDAKCGLYPRNFPPNGKK